MRTYGIATALLLIVAAGQIASPEAPQRASRLFKDSRQTLAIARAQGRRDIVLVVAALPNRAEAVAGRARELGGEVRYRNDEVGYLRVRLPIDRASEFAEYDQIESVAADRDESYPGRLSPPAQSGDPGLPSPQDPAQWPPRWGDYPLRHPYSPLSDIGAADFRAKHPTFDGRGVTIALIDGNLDLLLPEFQTAYALDGTPIRKVADFLNVTDPRDDADLNPQWVDMREEVTAQGLHVSFQGKTFTAPRDGRFRIGLFSERKFNQPANAAYIDQDLDRDGNPKGDDGLFGVLWDEQTNEVWVDTDRDLNFADGPAMTDYAKHQDIGVFGHDDPSTPVRDTIGFAVQTDPKNKFISINVGVYQHATEIMGSVVGNREPNGRLQGIAPGAQIMSMFWGIGIAHSMIEGLIKAFADPRVDLIVLEQHVGVASLPYLLADAHHPVTVIVQRLIERYRKLLFVPGSNAPGFGLVAEDGLAPGAFSVGGYQSQESYRLNAGFIPEPVDNMHWGALSHGPSGIGALKPDMLAPSGQMSTDPGYRKGAEIKGLFELPPGYAIDGGTSTATPMAAGATALVVSAAKQTKVPYDAFTLKAALTGSARFISRLSAHEQGNGLVQVEAAYERLKQLEKAPQISITSTAPVRTRLSQLLPIPNQGVGIYEREGWAAGDHASRTIRLTRHTGSAEPMTFDLTWAGNDGSFTGPKTVVLPLNQPVDLQVDIAVHEMGPHSAILNLTHPSIPGFAYRVLNTVVAAARFNEANKFTVTSQVLLPRPGDRGLFVDVPPGVAALKLSANSADGTVRIFAISPEREQYYAPGQPFSLPRPEPGVWEVNVTMNGDAREFNPNNPQPLKASKVNVTAALVGFTVTAEKALDSELRPGAARDISVDLANHFSPVAASAVGMPLGSAFQTKRTISQGEQHIYEVNVPKGATSLQASVTGVANGDADLDIYLFDCTPPPAPPAPTAEREKGNKSPGAVPPSCTPRAKAATIDAGGIVEVADPQAGRWVVVVDAYSIPGGRTSYSYEDVFTHPSFGMVSTNDVPDQHETGGAWSSTAHIWAARLPEQPRKLVGRVAVSNGDVRTAAGTSIPLGFMDIDLGARPKSGNK